MSIDRIAEIERLAALDPIDYEATRVRQRSAWVSAPRFSIKRLLRNAEHLD
jgi:hypothetical protein